MLVTLSAIFAWLNHRFIRMPATIGLMLIALLFSLAIVGLSALGFASIEKRATSIIAGVDFDTALLHGMLSFLLFAGALHVNLAELNKQKWVVAVLATVGVIISTFVVGLLAWVALGMIGVKMPLIYCLIFGALISPTDPIAVLGILKKVNAPKSLEIKIAGESLFNDGVGVPATTSHRLIEVFLSGVKRLAVKDVMKNDWAEALHEAASQDIGSWNTQLGPKVMEALAAARKGWKDQAGFQILWNTVRCATRPGPEPGTELLNPEKFMVNVTKNGTEIRKRFGEQTYNSLLNLARFMMQAQGEDIPKALSYGMLAGQVAPTGYQPGLLLPEGAHALFVLSLMKPKGWVKAWLTKGAFPSLPPVAAAAGKAALYEQAGEREPMPGAIPWRR